MRSGNERGRWASLAGADSVGAIGGESDWADRPAKRSRVRKVLGMGKAGVSSLAERLVEVAPRIPVRDLETLRRQFPGLGPEEIADRLIAAAMKGSAAVGAGVGAAAMMPTPPAMAAELATETLAVAAVEYKLTAELHELYGLRVPGTAGQRASAYLWSWSEQRGIDVLTLSSVHAAFGGTMKRELRQKLLKRTARNLPTLTPFLVGAAVGALMNRRDTRRLAERLRQDLRAHQIPWETLPPTSGEDDRILPGPPPVPPGIPPGVA
jgi:hypothetical protein